MGILCPLPTLEGSIWYQRGTGLKSKRRMVVAKNNRADVEKCTLLISLFYQIGCTRLQTRSKGDDQEEEKGKGNFAAGARSAPESRLNQGPRSLESGGRTGGRKTGDAWGCGERGEGK